MWVYWLLHLFGCFQKEHKTVGIERPIAAAAVAAAAAGSESKLEDNKKSGKSCQEKMLLLISPRQ